jgi:hypothetical protein
MNDREIIDLFEEYNKAYQENTNLELINKYKEILSNYQAREILFD